MEQTFYNICLSAMGVQCISELPYEQQLYFADMLAEMVEHMND